MKLFEAAGRGCVNESGSDAASSVFFATDKELAIQKIWIQHATRRLFDKDDKPLKVFANGSGISTPTKTESPHDHTANSPHNNARTLPEVDGIVPLSLLSGSPRCDVRAAREGVVGSTGITDPDLRRVMLRVPMLLSQEPVPPPVLEPLDFSCVEKKTRPDGKDTVRSLLREALCKTRSIVPVEIRPATGSKLVAETGGAERSNEKDAKSDESLARSAGDEAEKNSCPYCSKTFQYRSSYRRHVKIHQGIFSHMCYVCGRKFTRKEHFVRHKCNRRPNKPNRGHDPGLDPGSAVFPPDCQMSSLEAEEGEEVTTDLDETKLSIKLESRDDDGEFVEEVSFIDEVTDEEFSRLHESRRKSSTPRKIVVANESPSDASDTESGFGKKEANESFFSERGTEDEGNVRRHEIEGFLVPRGEKNRSNEGRDSTVIDCISSSNGPSLEGIPIHGGLHGSIPGTPEKSSAFGPSGFLNLQTGSYKVEEIDDDEATSDSGGKTSGKVITIKKQAKYLKLKNEAHIVDGNLCFSCPHCFKTFHRSSNFSRHMRIHRGVYSYICQTCSRGFFRREHFQKHKCHRKSMSTVCDRRTKFELLQSNVESGDVSPLENSGDFGDWPLTSAYHVADSANSLLIPASVETAQ